jgi:Ca-activated chloride channel homolog
MICGRIDAQTNKYVREGNQLYEQKKYKEAAADYQKALVKNPTYVPGLFNLGNSLYQQKQFEAARKVLNTTAKTAKDKDSKAGANYNIGNTYMQEQKWQDAIDAYKQTLRNNPQDADAKYNLSYANEMLKKQQNQDKNKNKDKNKDNKKDQDKDKQDKDKQNKDKQDKEKQDKDKQDQQNKDQQNKDQQDKNQDKDQQHPQSQPSKLSQQQADQLLNALQQEEKKLQDKMQKAKGVPIKTEKDW